MNITITGRVQGVGFRFSARKLAISLGLKGFVRNEYDGSVYIEAEGQEYNLNHFLKWCHEGPAYARPENVEYSDGVVKGFKTFDIRH